MELTNEFRVGVPVAEAWKVLTDVERIAPCLPGAQLLEVEGDEYRGTVKVKVGPITATYKGAATFVERDEAGGRVVLRAEGREARGQGNASAVVTATLAADGDGTAVTVATDLTITGRVAQFGRGVLADVSAKLLDQFVACLEQTVLAPSPIAAALAGERPGEPAPPARSARPAPGIPGMPSPGDDPLAGSEWMAADDTGGDVTTPFDQDAAAGPADRDVAPPVPDVSADREPAPPVSGNGSAAGAGTTGLRSIDSEPAAPVDLLGAAGAPLAKRAVPVAGVLVVVLWLFRRRRRRRARA